MEDSEGAGQMRIVVVDPTICVACRNCEYACAFKQCGDFDTRAANIRVSFYPEERVCIPWTCIHCGEPWCLEICPAGAIARHPETGAIEIDPQACAGCKMCLLACPSGSIHFDGQAMVSRKCDLCGGDPSCVKFCISGALQFVEAEEAHAGRREALDARLMRLLGLDRRETRDREGER